MPNMQLCANGHYFDSERYAECPYCKPEGTYASGGDQSPINVTTPLRDNPLIGGSAQNMDKTVRMVVKETGIDPVVGWLVCVKGGDKGKDFRLHSGNNFVGRDADRDVCIQGDASVSGKHFSVSYDQRHDRYFISMGEGKEIVYVNDEPLTAAATTLKKGDKIEVAGTTLVFIPLDKEDVQWEWEK